mgnify:CR=1 FL=1
MGPRKLAELVTPNVRAAMEFSKEDVLAEYPPAKRLLVRTVWPLIMGVLAPILVRVVIELLLVLYRKHLKDYVESLVDAYLATIRNTQDEDLKRVHDYLSVLQSHPSSFHTGVVAVEWSERVFSGSK